MNFLPRQIHNDPSCAVFIRDDHAMESSHRQGNLESPRFPRRIWQIKTTLAHWRGRAALPRRLLADQQVSPAGLAFVPMLIETAINTPRTNVSLNFRLAGLRYRAARPSGSSALPY
jgi:hypothetical protein